MVRCRSQTSFSLLAIALISATGWTQSGRLEFADRIRLVSCDPSTTKPCFRLKLNAIDQKGSPVNLDLAPDKDLHNQMRVLVENSSITPFFAVAQSAGGNTTVTRMTLILVDISGSMNHLLGSGMTRFQTAQEALRHFLQNFDPSSDRVAIVPFESHNVAEHINDAQFASTKEEAIGEIESLPAPQPRNNTALYSAVVLGISLLAKQGASSSGSSPETQLIVMTDGKNEVYQADDPGLLDGAAGLKKAAAMVRSSGTEVIGVGFGDPGSIDEAALQQLSSKSYSAQDLSQLQQVFSLAHGLLVNRIVATFESPWPDRSSLESKTLRLSATLDLPGGRHFESGVKTWEAPEMGVPTFEGKCDTNELKAALQIAPVPGNWLSVLRPILVFFGLGTALLVLWFWVPRLVWPEQYIGTFTTQRGMRWENRTLAGSVGSSRRAPPGFEKAPGGGVQPPRTPADRTVLQPDLSKSRLQKRPVGEQRE